MTSLLLDEMFSGAIAEQLRTKSHDALAVVAGPALIGLPSQIQPGQVLFLQRR